MIEQSPHNIFAAETARLHEIADNTHNHKVDRADAYLELAQLHQKDSHKAWTYVWLARDVLQSI